MENVVIFVCIYTQGYKQKVVLQNCAPLGYYTVCNANSLPTHEDGTRYVVPKRRYGITATGRVTAQKSTVLVCFVAEDGSHSLSCYVCVYGVQFVTVLYRK